MSVGFIEPHLKRYGGIRRVIELSNALVARGHDVKIIVPDHEKRTAGWMRVDADVVPFSQGFDLELDIVLFNHEPHWHLLERFERAKRTGFYALHFSSLYQKEGSWESLRTPVDLRLANSTWTADRVEDEIGVRPHVLLGGINPSHFRPVDVPERYRLLCVGDDRAWKGTDVIEEAARRAGIPVERYAGKNLPQERMAQEYCSARQFVVGSDFEGFGQPGLEALACGVPLVTTDNGGCRDYAIDEETALVVPPRDPDAMAEALLRMDVDSELRRSLGSRGHDYVVEKFSWSAAAARFEELAGDVLATEPTPAPYAPNQRDDGAEPELSVVVLVWDNLTLTQRCVESVRQHTDVPYELILVDNGSDWETVNYVRAAGDQVVLHDHNTGFAAGMNSGMAVARGRALAFLNNDTTVPVGWASTLLESLDSRPEAAIVVPSLTTASNSVTVRTEPGETVELLPPFSAPPSGVLYLMRTDEARALGGFDEGYAVASGEDVDLGFTVWTNDREILFDSRVLIDHVGHATSDTKLENRLELWSRNRDVFLDKWRDPARPVARLDGVDDTRFERNRRTAAAAATWMHGYFRQRDRADASSARRAARSARVPRPHGAVAGALSGDLSSYRVRVVRAVWRRLRAVVPVGVRERAFPHVRERYYRFFPDRHPAALRGEQRRDVA